MSSGFKFVKVCPSRPEPTLSLSTPCCLETKLPFLLSYLLFQLDDIEWPEDIGWDVMSKHVWSESLVFNPIFERWVKDRASNNPLGYRRLFPSPQSHSLTHSLSLTLRFLLLCSYLLSWMLY